MKTEAKGKPEKREGQATQRISIGEFSTQRWPVRIQSPTPQARDRANAWGFTPRVTPLHSRELDLGELMTAVYQKLAA